MNKSSFLLNIWVIYQFEVEAAFFNTTTNLLEPISCSSHITPRSKKVSFGPLQTIIVAVDEKVIEISNKKDDKAQLLDSDDSLFKKTIHHLC